MIENIIRLSVAHKWVVGMLVFLLIGTGIYSAQQVNLDAVPDITINQVQVVTVSPSLSTQEMERIITHPLERSLSNLPDVIGLRSISKYGLSVITVIFNERTPVLDARQYVREQLDVAKEEIPPGYGSPQLMPITTGLGEVYQYVLRVDPEYRTQYDARELRTIQDWMVKRQLAGIPGVVEISSFGGSIKQYEVAIDPQKLAAAGFTLNEAIALLETQNTNSGGGYVTVGEEALYLRMEGFIRDLEEVRSIALGTRHGMPVLLGDVATVQWGNAPRFGAMTMDGQGEAVGGIALMLKNENAYDVVKRIEARMKEVASSLPEGVSIYPYLNRSDLVERTVKTAGNNLIEGGIIVLVVLILMLGNWRAGLIVASVIPLSMLFALNLMNLFGVSANLMSLGAIDFGIVVDGAVIVVENVLHVLAVSYAGQKLSRTDFNGVVAKSAANIYKTAAFGVLIILIVFVPILTLQGVEGKMFRPMAMTVVFAISGAFVLSLTYVPALSALVLKRTPSAESSRSDIVMEGLRNRYLAALRSAMKHSRITLGIAGALLVAALFGFSRMGSVFTPTLEEGDLAIQLALPAGSSLDQSIATSTQLEQILLNTFPEVEHVVSKIGSAEIPTDPMSIEDADVMVILKPRKEWVSATSREELVAQMKRALSPISFASMEFTQPIQLRFNELMTGSKSDLALSIFGEDLDTLARLGQTLAQSLEEIPGAADVVVEKTEGLPQLQMKVNRGALARYGISVDEVALLIRSSFSGAVLGQIYENERRFDWVIRLREDARNHPPLHQLFLRAANGTLVPASAVMEIKRVNGPVQISREHAQRKITVGINVRGRDMVGVVDDMERLLKSNGLPAGYSYKIGGEFEKLSAATERLKVAVPLALLSILLLLYLTFNNIKYALMIYSAIPLSAIGGIAFLMARGMPFSISAAVGFIALFGVSVLNGIVLIASFIDLRKKDASRPLYQIIEEGAAARIRPVLMTASVAALGFIPMAFSSSAGAEVQKPLATVVIGGLISATLLTLFVLPILFQWVAAGKGFGKRTVSSIAVGLLGFMSMPNAGQAQTPAQPLLSLEEAVKLGMVNSYDVQQADLAIQEEQAKKGQVVLRQPTQVTYTQGQIDGEVASDYQWQIMQNLGSLPSVLYELKAARAAIQSAEAARETQLREIRLQVGLAWNAWASLETQLTLLDSIQNAYMQRLDVINRRVSSGASDLFLAVQAERDYLHAQTQYRLAFGDYQTATRKLQELLVIADWKYRAPLVQPLWSLSGDSTLSEALWATEALRLEEQQLAVQQQNGFWFPQLSVGYMNQQLQGVPGYTGWMMGAQFPLWPLPQQKRVQQERIALDRMSLQLEQRQQHYTLLWETLQKERGQLEPILLQLLDKPAGPSSSGTFNAQLQKGLIDPADYWFKIALTYEQKLQQIQWIAQYNVCILKINYLAL